jgi:hypothetical protein
MSSPAIKYRSKVFAFYYDSAMVFKLGRDFKPEILGVHHYAPLAPFKTKPPMLDWFVVHSADAPRWEALAHRALSRMRSSFGNCAVYRPFD